MKAEHREEEFLQEFVRKVIFPISIIEIAIVITLLTFTRVPGKIVSAIGFGMLLNLVFAMFVTFNLGIYLLTKKDYTTATTLSGSIICISPLLGLAIPVAIGAFLARHFLKFRFRSLLKTL